MMKIDIGDIAGIAEIAEEFDTSRSAVCNWIERYADFPKPIRTLRSTRLYSLTAVGEWYDDKRWRT